MTNQKVTPLRCKIGPFEWEDRHPVLKTLARPLLEQVFTAAAWSLNTFAEIDDALHVIESELERATLSEVGKHELRLLRRAVASRGLNLTGQHIAFLLYKVAVGRRVTPDQRLTEHPFFQYEKRYRAILTENAPYSS